jgi:putative glutamine amidotransferase
MSKRVLVIYRELAEAQPYSRALTAVDIDPVLVEASGPVPLDGYGGLLLTGGSDVNPERYGETISPQTDPPDELRDALECALIEECLDRDLPLFGICRGLQILNVHLGGSLVQHVDSIQRHNKRTPDLSLPAHKVTLEPNTLLGSIAGKGRWDVNSRHHQAAARLGRGLRVAARDSEDGTVEAIEYTAGRFALAVQWHPEDQALTDSEQLKLFRAFAGALGG